MEEIGEPQWSVFNRCHVCHVRYGQDVLQLPKKKIAELQFLCDHTPYVPSILRSGMKRYKKVC